MMRCIELAKKGFGKVSPNPMVGCVIVHENKIIGEGYHMEYGAFHAEINALNSVKDKSLLKEASMYVSLEPCSHYGKTPPCSLAIIDAKIPRIFVAQTDPNPEVNGKGVRLLEEVGILVESGICEQEAKMLNKRFNTFHSNKRPYIILKWAETKDGFVDLIDRPEHEALKISSEQSNDRVQMMRATEDAFLVGYNTARQDNPRLSARKFKTSQALRVLLDPKLDLDRSYHLMDGSIPTIVFNGQKNAKENRIQYVQLDFEQDKWINPMLESLYNEGIQSLVVEGGPKTHRKFIEHNLWDEYLCFKANFEIHSGIPAVEKPATKKRTQLNSGKDILEIGYNYSL